ncbi:unnamed protein product [Effrenium voratum]|uniref:C2H2-type domain-containing protein n=1 Tax=Effrenium voratum TaxID=2562239 RepID=A0AA36I6V3_9DINO|nr:unnamed protein product [Effrenium voratum]CAJ1415596.1 unnamed protein product [Effrenium voratum]
MEEDPAVAAAVTEVIESMPKLLDGMLVNCDFSDCGEFEDSSSTGLFELFKLQLFHVWVDREVHKVAPNWNDLMDYLGFSAELQCILAEEQRAPSEEEEEKLCRASFLQEWLQANRAQATGEGIEGLQAQVSHGDVCVLFRNNHFCTVFRPAADLPCSDCCALLTDECFHGDSAPLWEILTLEGGQFLDAKFCPMEAEGLEAVQSADTWPSLQRPEAKPKGLLCPSCKKSFSTRNGLLCHRTAKSH